MQDLQARYSLPIKRRNKLERSFSASVIEKIFGCNVWRRENAKSWRTRLAALIGILFDLHDIRKIRIVFTMPTQQQVAKSAHGCQ